ncbi:Nucleobase-ascorbate transporter 12 [Glycine soja]
METGSSSEFLDKGKAMRGGTGKRHDVVSDTKVEPFVARSDHNPKELKSWAKRTGFVSNYSGEVGTSASENFDSVGFDRKIGDEAALVLVGDGDKKIGLRVNGDAYGMTVSTNRNINSHGVSAVAPLPEQKKEKEGIVEDVKNDTANVISTMLFLSGVTTILHCYFGTQLSLVQGSSFVYLAPALVIINAEEFRNLTHHKCRHIMTELQGAIIVGSIFQCILGLSGLMFLLLRIINPIVVAPTVAAVGLAFFSYGFPQAGTCMKISIPQIALVLLFTLKNDDLGLIYDWMVVKFKHQVRSSILSILTVGNYENMSELREISIALTTGRGVLKNTRNIRIDNGERLSDYIEVPLTVTLTWIYASFLTAGGGYNYKGCNPNIPSSNILIGACRKHAYTMKHCRTDISLTSAWLRILYPLQWGFPIFHFRTCIMMAIVSLAASVDSVGTYYSASLRVNLRPLSPGVVSRGIALEGLYSILAGLWGSGTGSTTLTENVQTIDTTKVASRRVVELGAAFMILFSFMGKVGALIASIPQALAASVLCFIWALIAALGLSNLQYGKCASFRNMKIVGVSLFLGPWSINPCLFSTIQVSNQSDTTCLPVTLWGCI